MTPAQLRTYAETSCSITDLGRANIHQAADDIEALTARLARLEALLQLAVNEIPHETVRCRGDKCRLNHCESCNGENEAEMYTKSLLALSGAIRQALES